MSYVTRMLVTGGSGILAHALRAYFPLATYVDRHECDVRDRQRVKLVFEKVKPEIVIHCAAVTRHDAEPMDYVTGNVQGTLNVVAAADKAGARLVYPSTDYLAARSERDAIQPVNRYAQSKYAGECAVQILGSHLVIRGSWYSHLNYTHAATDAFTSKLPVAKAAYYVAALAVSSATGVVNIGGARRSIYEIALEFNERVIPVRRQDLALPYEIPEDCSLDTTRLRSLLLTDGKL